MKRRTVVLGSLGLGAVAYGGTLATGALRPCAPFEVDNPLLSSAARIGERLLASGFDVVPLSDGGLEQLIEDLPDRTRADFAADETVTHDGWVMSRSEAEFCVHCAKLSGTAA